MAEERVLEMRAISKEYFGNCVLRNVDLRVGAGEIHGLVGENGAGKSTLMNILFGMPAIRDTGGYKGEVRLSGKTVNFASPEEALSSGIGMVHQEFMLLPGFSVAENIKLNREPLVANAISKLLGKRLSRIDKDRMRKDSRAALDAVGLGIDETLPVLGLPIGFMQFIEVAREIDKRGVKVLVFDEPTALLTESEAEKLLEALKRIASSGVAVIFISHRLEEVLRICDNITVLRDGEVVAATPARAATIELVAELMVGRQVGRLELGSRAVEPSKSDIALDIQGLQVEMPGEEVRDISLSVRRGEILGIGGLAGQGKVGIGNGIMGIYPARGAVLKDGLEIPLNRPGEAYRRKVAFLSEDRKGVGLTLERSIEYNITVVAALTKGVFLKRLLGGIGVRDRKSSTAHAEQAIRGLDIRCTGPNQLVKHLSGGNQQKVCVARALALEPEILLVSEPTRGIDVGAKEKILDIIVSMNRQKGVTVILASSELAELRRVCDRIAIVYGGRLVDVLSPDDSNIKFGMAMAGKKVGQA